jgi:hypothetical protein
MELLGPRDVLRGHPASADDMRTLVVARARQVGRSVTVDARTLQAYVNAGIWVADCPHCNSGIAIHPEWSFASCLGCLRTFADIAIPTDWKDIEAVLVERPQQNQHWLCAAQRTKWVGRSLVDMPAETVEELDTENAEKLDRGIETRVSVLEKGLT